MVRMRGPNRRQLYAEQTRADLVAAARKLFVDDGFAGTSVEAITGAAAVSKGTFYHHYLSGGKVAAYLARPSTDSVHARLAPRARDGGSD